jgi:1-acyl-sn-glycerol-3-phosphate acyltransferase
VVMMSLNTPQPVNHLSFLLVFWLSESFCFIAKSLIFNSDWIIPSLSQSVK